MHKPLHAHSLILPLVRVLVPSEWVEANGYFLMFTEQNYILPDTQPNICWVKLTYLAWEMIASDFAVKNRKKYHHPRR